MEQIKKIDLTEIVMALLHRGWIVVVAAVLFGILGYAHSAKFDTPMYSASVTLYVVNNRSTSGSSGVNAADLATAQRLVLTYVNLLKSYTVLDKVAESVDADVTAGQIKGMISASSIDDTEIFTVTISHTDPVEAAQIANAIADVAPEVMANYVEGSTTKIVDYARVPGAPYAPNKTSKAIKWAMIAAVLVMAGIILQVLLDGRIKSEMDLAQLSEAPVLGVIPDLMTETKNEYSYKTEKPAKEGSEVTK